MVTIGGNPTRKQRIFVSAAVLSVVVVVLQVLATPPAEAASSGWGRKTRRASGRRADNNSGGAPKAEVWIDGTGTGSSSICLASKTPTRTTRLGHVDYEMMTRRVVVDASDPPTYVNQEYPTDVVIRTWNVVTVTCGDSSREFQVCVPGPTQPKTVCPPVDPIDGKTLALHDLDMLDWVDIMPLFAPDVTGEGGAFAIAQAPIFFWFSDVDYAEPPPAFAFACNEAGCITAITYAVPTKTGFMPGVDGLDIECRGNGAAIIRPSFYEDARRDKVCHQYTYHHSSTTVGGPYSSTGYIDYQIEFEVIDEAGIASRARTLDVGNIWETYVDVPMPVGEIEGVVR